MTSFSQLHFPGRMSWNFDSLSPGFPPISPAHLAYICLLFLLFMFSLANCACYVAMCVLVGIEKQEVNFLWLNSFAALTSGFFLRPTSNKLKINQVLTRLPICLRPNCVLPTVLWPALCLRFLAMRESGDGFPGELG